MPSLIASRAVRQDIDSDMTQPYGVPAQATSLVSDDGRVRIRPLTQTDLAVWTQLWRGYLDFYDTQLSEAQYALTWARIHDPAEPQFGYVADVGTTSEGLVHIIFHRSGWTAAPSCYLQDLYVNPAVRGTQVGKALIDHALRVAHAAGSAGVYWLTHETNTYAMRLYDRVADKTGFLQYRKNS
jgi:GNAT superfamily N-acetyltransferase